MVMLFDQNETRTPTPEAPNSGEAWWKNKTAVVALLGTLAAGGIGGAVLASGEDTPNPEPTATAPENPISEVTPNDSQSEQTQNPEIQNELEGYMPLKGNDPEKIIDAFVNNFELAMDNTDSRYLTEMGYSLETNEVSRSIAGMLRTIEMGNDTYALTKTNEGNYNPMDLSWDKLDEKPMPELLTGNQHNLDFHLTVFKFSSENGKYDSTDEGSAGIEISRSGDNWNVDRFKIYFPIDTEPFA